MIGIAASSFALLLFDHNRRISPSWVAAGSTEMAAREVSKAAWREL